MRFALLVLALFLCINVSYAEIYAAPDTLSKNGVRENARKASSHEFQSSQEAFLDFNRSFKWDTPLLDENRAEQAPIETVLDFY